MDLLSNNFHFACYSIVMMLHLQLIAVQWISFVTHHFLSHSSIPFPVPVVVVVVEFDSFHLRVEHCPLMEIENGTNYSIVWVHFCMATVDAAAAVDAT